MVIAVDSVESSLQHQVLVGDVERRKDGDTQRIYCRRLLRNEPHLGVDIVSELVDVFGVGTAKLIRLIVDFDTNTAVAVRLSQASLHSWAQTKRSLDGRFAPTIIVPILRPLKTLFAPASFLLWFVPLRARGAGQPARRASSRALLRAQSTARAGGRSLFRLWLWRRVPP